MRLVTLSLLCALAPAVHAQKPAPRAAAGARFSGATGGTSDVQTYADPDGRFTVGYPGAWTLPPRTSETPPSLCFSAEGVGDEVSSYVTVACDALTADTQTVDDLLESVSTPDGTDELMDGYRADLGEGWTLALADAGPAQLGLLPAIRLQLWITYTGEGGQTAFFQNRYIADAPDGTAQYALDCGTYGVYTSAVQDRCDALASTFALR